MSDPAGADRLLLLEHAESQRDTAVRDALANMPGLRCAHALWKSRPPDGIVDPDIRLIVAIGGRQAGWMIELFDWLRRTPTAPTLALLPESPEKSLLRAASECADDFLLAPIRPHELEGRLCRLLRLPPADIATVQTRLADEMALSQLVGEDPALRAVLAKLPLIARTDAPVLITGETGTGKELCARAIHHLGARRALPFVAVDCGTFPDHLFENELFGHVRGAFTDAHREQKGLVALAQGGTLLLDEVDALSHPAQAKLLRFLQERTYRPLGSERFLRADVNVIAATNRDLEDCVQSRAFRSDLYFRLNVLRVHLPALRDRHSDISLLAMHFLRSLCRPGEAGPKTFAPSALRKLALHHWPGNVRELYNVVRRAALMSRGSQILPDEIAVSGAESAAVPRGSFRAARADAVAIFERRYVEELLAKHAGNVTRAAREAQKDRRAFGRLVKKYRVARDAAG